jgi:hypothetical protein
VFACLPGQTVKAKCGSKLFRSSQEHFAAFCQLKFPVSIHWASISDHQSTASPLITYS